MPYANIEDQRAYNREYYRPRMAESWRRFRRAGGCGECGAPVTRFARCLRHRLMAAKTKRRYRARRAC